MEVKLTCHLEEENTLKNCIRELRKAKNMTQEELSIRVNVSRQSIVAIETGKYNPSLQLAYHIARQFDLRIEDVFYLEESETD